MVAIPTLEDEDARRPSRERESLVGERTRIINRMKAILAWLGVRGFNPTLRKAPQRLDELRTPQDLPLPPNTVDELRRDMARLAMVCEHIKALEQARLANLEQAPGTGTARDGASHCQRSWCRHRDSRHAGSGSAIP
jgi:transposase